MASYFDIVPNHSHFTVKYPPPFPQSYRGLKKKKFILIFHEHFISAVAFAFYLLGKSNNCRAIEGLNQKLNLSSVCLGKKSASVNAKSGACRKACKLQQHLLLQ